jgi:hypothetical protein
MTLSFPSYRTVYNAVKIPALTAYTPEEDFSGDTRPLEPIPRIWSHEEEARRSGSSETYSG